jgi:hypothetical protein
VDDHASVFQSWQHHHRRRVPELVWDESIQSLINIVTSEARQEPAFLLLRTELPETASSPCMKHNMHVTYCTLRGNDASLFQAPRHARPMALHVTGLRDKQFCVQNAQTPCAPPIARVVPPSADVGGLRWRISVVPWAQMSSGRMCEGMSARLKIKMMQ